MRQKIEVGGRERLRAEDEGALVRKWLFRKSAADRRRIVELEALEALERFAIGFERRFEKARLCDHLGGAQIVIRIVRCLELF